MFVLLTLLHYCQQCACVLFVGVQRPQALVQRAQIAILRIAIYPLEPIAPLHVPLPRLIV